MRRAHRAPGRPIFDAGRAAVQCATALVLILVALTACKPDHEPIDNASDYRSIWVELYPGSLRRDLAKDTLQGSFYAAAAAETRTVAEDRWSGFLSAWSPAGGEFEDGMHAHLVTWAELEMQRLRYLKKKDQSAAEAVSKKLRGLAAESE